MYRRTPILYRIADSFFRLRWPFLLTLLIVSGVTMSFLYLRSKTFQATALTQVVTPLASSVVGGQDNYGASPAQWNADHFSDLINDDQPGGFLDTALKKADLVMPIDVNPKADDPRYATLRKSLGIYPSSANIFAISLTWDNPDECERIVSALQQQYIEKAGLDQSAQSSATAAFLDSQIKDYAQRLSVAEQALTEYKQKNQGQSPDAASSNMNELQTLKTHLAEMQITAQAAALKMAALQAQLSKTSPMSVQSTTTGTDPYLTRLNAMKAQRDDLLTHELPTHPEVRALTTRIDALEKQYQAKLKLHAPETLGNQRTTMQTNPEYQQLQQQLTEAQIEQKSQASEMQLTQQQIGYYQVLVAKIPAAQRALTDKTRDYGVLRNQYDSLLNQREQVKREADLHKVTATASLSPASLIYAQPTTGKTKMVAMLVGSLVLGLIVGIILVVMFEWGDSTLRYEGDAERLLGVPVLAVLPENTGLRFLPTGSGRRARALPPPA